MRRIHSINKFSYTDMFLYDWNGSLIKENQIAEK